MAASVNESITRVSNASDFAESVHSLLESGSDADSADLLYDEPCRPAGVFMVDTGDTNEEPDPFTTPLPANATAAQVEEHRKRLDAAKKKEVEERNKFRLELRTQERLASYRDRRIRDRLGEPQPITRALDFSSPGDPNAGPSNRPPPGGTPNPPPPPPPPEQPRNNPPPPPPARELDPITQLPLFSTPMDNVIAIEAAIADLQPEGDDALKINYVKALVAKAVEQ